MPDLCRNQPVRCVLTHPRLTVHSANISSGDMFNGFARTAKCFSYSVPPVTDMAPLSLGSNFTIIVK